MIYDRTILDVNEAKKIIAKFQALYDWSSITQDEIETLERGTYTTISLNRVENKVEELCSTLVTSGYMIDELSIKNNWNYMEYFNKTQHERFFYNIKYLRSSITVFPDTPQPPFFTGETYRYGNIDYLLANNAEKILQDIQDIVDYLTSGYYYKACNSEYAIVGSTSELWRVGRNFPIPFCVQPVPDIVQFIPKNSDGMDDSAGETIYVIGAIEQLETADGNYFRCQRG